MVFKRLLYCKYSPLAPPCWLPLTATKEVQRVGFCVGALPTGVADWIAVMAVARSCEGRPGASPADRPMLSEP